MPKKGADRRKGRRNRNIGTTPSSTVGTSGAGGSNGTNVKTSPQQTRGRSTKNSRQGRTNPPRSSSAVPSHPKKPSSQRFRGKGRPNHSPDQPIYFTSSDGELYKPGDFAYVDSQQPDLPFHICLIRSFKLARKESVIAEVKWFYRVSELPEAVYCLLMEDRKKGPNAASFEFPRVNERELFTAFNIDTHPASLFKGKCVVKEISDIKNIAEYNSKPDHFFYQHGYKPESRRITQLDEFSIIPHSQQAVLPDLITKSSGSEPDSDPPSLSIVKKEFMSTTSSSIPLVPPTPAVKQEDKKDITVDPPIDRYQDPNLDEKIKGSEELVWYPGISDDNLLMYLRAARSVALHAGVFINGLIRDGYMAASSDETTQHAFDVLHKVGYNTETALLDIVKKPIVDRLYNKRNWSKENSLLFAKGMRQFGKNFYKIKKELLPNKEIHELIEYYYYWKKTNAGLTSRNTRKQRKQTHIKMSRIAYKQPEISPEREFIDLSSASEDEVGNEDSDKCLSFHACRHCFNTESGSWHHAGSNKAILCTECRVHFQRYGFMRELSMKRDPPDFMFKDYHLALAEESGRKTRNSNGIRLPRTGLRNGKVFSKSDSDDEDEEGDITDASEFSTDSTTDIHSVSNPKSLPSRRSLLDLLQPEKLKPTSTSSLPSSSNASLVGERQSDEPPNKKPKIEEHEGNESEDEGSGGDSTTNGEAEDEHEAEGDGSDNRSQQSQEEKESGSHSPDSSNTEESRNISHVPSVHTPSATATLNKDLLLEPVQEHIMDPVPQQFKRVREDSENTCARTDLVYVHPPAHEKKAITDPQKTIPPHIPSLNFNPGSAVQPPPAPLTSSSNHPLAGLTQIPPTANPQLPPHLHQSQPRPTGVVPIITPHDPALPAFINIPGPTGPPHPITPVGTPFVNIPNAASVGGAIQPPSTIPPPTHANEKEMLWNMNNAIRKQQQQQIEMAAAQAQHMPAGPIHFHPPPPPSVPHTHPPSAANPAVSQQQQQPLIFQFPNMEEMMRAQRHGGGIPEGLAIMPGQFPQLLAATAGGLPLEARPRPPDEAQNLQGIQYAAVHPGIALDMVQQQVLLQHQQPPLIGHLPEALELQQQVENIVQEYQKDPSIMLHPQVRDILAQYQATQNNMYLQQQQQHMQQELMMHQLQQQQQEALKHQHKQQQQKYHQGGGTSGSAAMRPGVIISNSK